MKMSAQTSKIIVHHFYLLCTASLTAFAAVDMLL
jgi:hypothetical protein